MAKKGKAPQEGKTKKPLFKRWWFWVIVVLVVGVIGAAMGGGEQTADDPSGSAAQSAESEGQTETPEPEASDFVLDVGSLTVSDIGELDTGNLALKNGDLVSVNYGGDGVIVVKAKIQALLSDDQTVKQNYFTVCDLIKNRGFDTCQELQYWAVADMSNGEESKVISFTLDRSTIEDVANGTIIENQLGDYVSDLYIHPSLQ